MIAVKSRKFDLGAAAASGRSGSKWRIAVTGNVATWRTDVVAQIIDRLGLDKTMFEAADPPVFEWYIKTCGAEANLFVDHSQIAQLECLRSGIWGTKSSWGRVVTYKEA